MMWLYEQIERWHLIQRAYLEDTETVKRDQGIDLKRSGARQEMLQLLTSFLEGTVSLHQFNTLFQSKTHHAWETFRLRGMSGGLFLNKLVKHVPDEQSLAHQLRTALQRPKDAGHSPLEASWDGKKSMHNFVQFLERLIASRQVLRSQLQPARAPFFLSIWWHLQAIEQWPIFYFHTRQALRAAEMALPVLQYPVEEYFEFRSCFTSLAKELAISSWQLEHLCAWYTQKGTKGSFLHRQKALCAPDACTQCASNGQGKPGTKVRSDRKNGSPLPQEKVLHVQTEESQHTSRAYLLWLLATIGHKAGYQVWIVADEHHTFWEKQPLGTLSLKSLPSLEPTLVQELLQQVDIVWLQGKQIVAIYEIEQTLESISTDLLRLCDVRALLPRREVHLCVVTHNQYFERIQSELARPTFRRSERLRDLAIISIEMLVQHQEHLLRWISKPPAVRDLIIHLSNVGRA